MTAASTVSPDAALSAAVVLLIAVLGAAWKLGNTLGAIRREVEHNGGGSLKDYVHRIGGKVDEIHTDVAEVKEAQTRIDTRVTEHRRRNDDAAKALREHVDRKIAALAEARHLRDEQ
jgi:hypothetical protein